MLLFMIFGVSRKSNQAGLGFVPAFSGSRSIHFGGGNYKLNFYEGPSFVVCVNFKPKGEPKWIDLLPAKAGTNPNPA